MNNFLLFGLVAGSSYLAIVAFLLYHLITAPEYDAEDYEEDCAKNCKPEAPETKSDFHDYIDFLGLFDWLLQEHKKTDHQADEISQKIAGFNRADAVLKRTDCLIESANIIFVFEKQGKTVELAFDREENRFVDYLESENE
jgi:hypothetical protein